MQEVLGALPDIKVRQFKYEKNFEDFDCPSKQTINLLRNRRFNDDKNKLVQNFFRPVHEHRKCLHQRWSPRGHILKSLASKPFSFQNICALVLGLERGCPWHWPRIFFVSLALSSVPSTPPLVYTVQHGAYECNALRRILWVP